MTLFERYLSLWVFLCIVAGIGLGQIAPGLSATVGEMQIAQVNLPVGILIWVMIIPMLVKVDFGALGEMRRHLRGIGVTLVVNWLVKPFSMALLGWLFIRELFAPWLPAEQIDSYIAGLVLLAAAPCTAMVFVWSRLTHGDPLFTLSQVALNDLIMVFAFAPIVALLLGISAITVPWSTLLVSVRGAAVAAMVARTGTGAIRCRDGACGTLVHNGAARHAGATLRLPGTRDPPAAAGDRLARGAHPDTGVLQCGACLLAEPCTG
jgi:ACR3 family arsenite transporter